MTQITTPTPRSTDATGATRPAVPDAARPRLPEWARVLLAVPMMFVAAIAPSLLTAAIPAMGPWFMSLPPAGQAAVLLSVYALSSVLGYLLVRLAMRSIDRLPFAASGIRFDRRALPALALGLVATVPAVVALNVALTGAGVLRPDRLPFSASAPLAVMVLGWLGQAFLLQGIPEELIWRGYVFNTLRRGPIATVSISAAVFALCHLVSSGGQQNLAERFIYLAMPFGFAFLAGALVIRTRSVWSAVGVHGGIHTAMMIGVLGFHAGTGPVFWGLGGAMLTAIGAVILATRDRSADALWSRPGFPALNA